MIFFIAGGGKAKIVEDNDLTQRLLGIIGPTLDGITNPFDCDADYQEGILKNSVTSSCMLLCRKKKLK